MRAVGARALALAAPAKVNLGLRILGRRSDGYHLLESLFLPLELADAIEVSVGPSEAGDVAVQLEVLGERSEGVPADASNLAARAAAGFLEAGGVDGLAVRIRLEKRIPAQAGLGGGSSDAAAVLRALATLLPRTLEDGPLCGLALRLGADVPFFLDPRPARVGGIGERIDPVEWVSPLWLMLVHPGVGLATAEVYAAYDALEAALTPAEAGPTVRPPGGPLDPPALAGLLESGVRNDLEPAAVRLCPLVARLRREIAATGALGVGMSGSGPTLFGVFEDERSARAAASRLEERGASARTGRGDAAAGRDSSRPRRWIQVTRTASAPAPIGRIREIDRWGVA